MTCACPYLQSSCNTDGAGHPGSPAPTLRHGIQPIPSDTSRRSDAPWGCLVEEAMGVLRTACEPRASQEPTLMRLPC